MICVSTVSISLAMLYDSAMSHSGIIFPKVLLGTSKLFTEKLLRIIFNTHNEGFNEGRS